MQAIPGIMSAALLEGPQAMGMVLLEGDLLSLSGEVDRFEIGLAAYRQALTVEQASEDSLKGLRRYQRTFGRIRRERVTAENVGLLRTSYYELSALLQGIDEGKRSRAAERVRQAITPLVQGSQAVAQARADLSAPVKVTRKSHPALYHSVETLGYSLQQLQRVWERRNVTSPPDIRFIGQLVQLSFQEALSLFGGSVVQHFSLALNSLNLRLGMHLEGFDVAEAERLDAEERRELARLDELERMYPDGVICRGLGGGSFSTLLEPPQRPARRRKGRREPFL